MNSFWRLWLLPMMGLAMLPAAFFNLFAMRQTALIGCLLGIGLPFIAARIMKRARKGDAKRAAVLMGVAAGLATGLVVADTPTELAIVENPVAKADPGAPAMQDHLQGQRQQQQGTERGIQRGDGGKRHQISPSFHGPVMATVNPGE